MITEEMERMPKNTVLTQKMAEKEKQKNRG